MRGTAARLAYCATIVSLSTGGLGAASDDSELIKAAKSRNIETVRALLNQEVDIDAPQADGATALHWAVYWDETEMVELLLGANSDVNAQNELGATPLWLACTEGRSRMVKRLLRSGADPNIALRMGETPLMAASRAGNAEAVAALLAGGADAHASEPSRGQTALMWAVAELHPKVVQVLIDYGADIEARSKIRRLVWNTGSDGGRDPGSIVEQDDGGFTPLLFAARVGAVASARHLVAAGVDIENPMPTGASPLAVAAFSGHTAFVEFLLNNGANPNKAGAGYTSLHAAVLRGDVDMVNALIAHGADPSAPLMKGTGYRRGGNDWALSWLWIDATPLWIAARLSDAELMRLLARAGAEPNFVMANGTTLLMAPVAKLSERGRRIGVRSPREESRATEQATVDPIQAALDLGADVNAADEQGNTALHAAAAGQLNGVVQLLAAHDANLELQNEQEETPLMLASTQQRRRLGDRANGEADSEKLSTADLLRQLGATQ